jgi:hypothetical protein
MRILRKSAFSKSEFHGGCNYTIRPKHGIVWEPAQYRAKPKKEAAKQKSGNPEDGDSKE